MLVKLLLLLLIILIALFLIIFSEPIHISVDFNFIDNLKKGHIEAKYYFIKIIKSFDANYAKVIFDTSFFSKDLKSIPLNDDEFKESNLNNNEVTDLTGDYDDVNKNEDSQYGVDLSSENENSTHAVDGQSSDDSIDFIYLIRKYMPDLLDLKYDLLDIIIEFRKIIFFDENYIKLSFGLMDNNATIKLSSFLWALTAPFYAAGLNIIIMPEMNQYDLKFLSKLHFELSLLTVLKVVFKIISNRKLIKMLINLFGEFD